MMKKTNLSFKDLPLSTPLDKKSKREGTFSDNMSMPIHRWYRYSAGFSAEWVERIILDKKTDGPLKVLDPFAGSGTTLLSCAIQNTPAVGFEAHPFIFRVAKAKINWNCDLDYFKENAERVKKRAQKTPGAAALLSEEDESSLLFRCFDQENLLRLEKLRDAYIELSNSDPEWELVWLCITSIVRSCSTAGTAQWQYVLPNKSKARVSNAFDAFDLKVSQIIQDINTYKSKGLLKTTQKILLTDARDPDCSNKFDLLITSPPYPNNYDYADSTRLEMTFWKEISGWGDLQETVRQFLIRSCTQHATAEKIQLDDIFKDTVLDPIRDEITIICKELEKVRLTKGGKKSYHLMTAAYFLDLADTFHSLRKLMKENSDMCFVIGDSAPYGIYLPVEKWLGVLALSAGFKDWSFEKIRDRNIKWKNRKHTVPLKEGRLWIKG